MIELSIHFTSDEKDEASPITVDLFRPDAGTRTKPVPFEPPLDEAALDDLEWYLEVFASWPTGLDYDRAERIRARLEDWGRDLLAAVTPGREPAELWRDFERDEAEGKLVTIDAVEPRVLRLPWELLANEGGHLFAQGIGLRRRLARATAGPIRPFALPVRLLVVVSRPEGAGFIDPRAVSRPLLDALDALGERVAVEFLYPPTLRALTGRLRDRAAPPVHVVHFDGHGVYDVEQGLGHLLFENEKHQADLVDADRLGTLLSGCGVPLMVLNACQSAAQEEGNPYASVAARLIRAGMGSVLAMNYSVLVGAVRKFVPDFYGGLAAGRTVGGAVDRGRYALLADEERHTLTRRDAAGDLVEKTVRLRDWFLPALYQQAADPVVFGPHPPEAAPGPRPRREPPRALTDPTVPGGLPPEPTHGFHGRAREMLRVERALAEKAVVVLHGFGGLGKTALAAEAGRWFHRTGRFPGGAAFVSFEHGGSLQQLCSWVGQAVSGDPDFVVHGEGDPVERVAALLRERPALVILDNFESVLGRAPLMPVEERRAVLDAVWRWSGGAAGPGRGAAGPGSRVLVTTRDTALAHARFEPSAACLHLELGGLERDDALALAAAVLDDHGIDRAGIERRALVELMDRLGGHPLSLNLVLPHLRRYTPAELTARFEELLPGFITGAARERNESLAVSLEFSLRRLGAETRAALPDLAVFQGAAFEENLLAITGIDPELWRTARAEMEAAALVRVETIPGVNPPFLRFHPTLLPYLAGGLPEDRRAGLEARYWQRYYDLAGYLYDADAQTPHQARAIAQRELPNLLRALELAVEAGAAEEAADFATSIAWFLDAFGRWRERDALLARVADMQGGGPTGGEGEGLTRAEYLMQSRRGETLLQQGRAAEAEAVFSGLLARLEAGAAFGGEEAAYDHALTLAWLGRCLAARGKPGQAVDRHRQALAELERLGESSEQAKQVSGVVYADLADNLVALGRFDEAQRAYESGLRISEEVKDLRGVGVKLGQLGTLALKRGDLPEAGRRYHEALETFRALGEPQVEAVAWHQLGRVAQEARDWDEAERCYREAVRIREQLRDLPELAKSYNQLAIVAEGAGRPDDAERWYLRAQEIKDRVSPHDASTLGNLAGLYLAQGRLEEAERYARRAVEIKESLDLSAEPWKTYAILARIAEARGRAGEAAEWRRKEIESRDAFAGTQHQLGRILQQFQPVIAAVVAACEGDAQSRAQVEGLFDAFERGNWRIVDAIRRIWAGERDQGALTAGIDYNSRAVVLAILARLTGEEPPAPPGPASRAAGEGAPGTPAVPPSAGPGSAAPQLSPEAARLLEQWAPVIGAVAAACRGSGEAAAGLEPLLAQLAQQDDWRALAAALRRVLAGERDPAALLPGLDATDALIAGSVLAALEPDPEPEGRGMTLEDLLALVGQACRPEAPPGLAAQLHGFTRSMAADPGAPAEIRALGRALNAVLSGERDPDLSALPPELAEAVRAMLAGD